MTHPYNTAFKPVDDSSMVRRRPVVQVVDVDADGKPDLFRYDVNGDGVAEIEHHVADRRTLVFVPSLLPWEPAPTVTQYTGLPTEIPLRVTFRIRRVSDVAFELNGHAMPSCLSSHGMHSLGVLWNADREHRDEVAAAQAFLLMNGVVRCFERVGSGHFAGERSK